MRKIFLVTNYACNNACISCAKKLDEQGRLSLNQIIEKIDLVKPSKDDYIEISGGEPTLREDVLDICRYIKSNYDTNLIILSNGRRFKDISFAKNIKEIGVDRVMTTFYSPYKEIHDLITLRKDSFSESLKGLKNLEEVNIPISVKTIILRQNYQHLPEFVEFAYNTFPTAWVSIHGLIIRGRAKDNEEQIVARYHDIKFYIEKALDVAIAKQKNLGIFVVPSCIIDPIYWQYLSINWKQMTKSMIYISPEETIFGNLDVAQSAYCSDCLINESCSWAWESAWKEYINRFGTNELNKVINSKLRDAQ
jgi:MoaA/NifB/PqqE/SkfB family radical SAM enzyme